MAEFERSAFTFIQIDDKDFKRTDSEGPFASSAPPVRSSQISSEDMTLLC